MPNPTIPTRRPTSDAYALAAGSSRSSRKLGAQSSRNEGAASSESAARMLLTSLKHSSISEPTLGRSGQSRGSDRKCYCDPVNAESSGLFVALTLDRLALHKRKAAYLRNRLHNKRPNKKPPIETGCCYSPIANGRRRHHGRFSPQIKDNEGIGVAEFGVMIALSACV